MPRGDIMIAFGEKSFSYSRCLPKKVLLFVTYLLNLCIIITVSKKRQSYKK